eukprot:16060756-Heterocapsa_arctica.AAC.1
MSARAGAGSARGRAVLDRLSAWMGQDSSEKSSSVAGPALPTLSSSLVWIARWALAVPCWDGGGA